MTKSSSGWVGPAIMVAGAYFVWRSGMLTSILSSVTGGVATAAGTTTAPLLTPATPPPPTTTGGQAPVNNIPNGPAELDLFAQPGFIASLTTITGNHGDLVGPSGSGMPVASLKSNGQNWTLYAGANYSGATVNTGGLDYANASVLLSPLGGNVASAKWNH